MKKVKISPDFIHRLRDGDHAAFELLLARHTGPLITFIRSLIGSEEEAEELTQNIFVSLWENRHSLDPDSNLDGYIFRMAKSRALNYLRHIKIRVKFHEYALHHAHESVENPPDALFEKEESEALISAAVNSMPEIRRKVYGLSRNDGYSNEKIAEELGIATATVKKHINLALKDIRKALEISDPAAFSSGKVRN